MKVTNLVLVQRGALPIILTAPHGGEVLVSGISIRTQGKKATDTKTFGLTKALVKELHDRLGRTPYVVAAKFRRKYIDANRPEAEAFEDPRAKPLYEDYHAHIRQFANELRQQNPYGALLIDIHGQSDDVSTVHQGTRDGLTVKRLLEEHGIASLIGPKSILGTLHAAGYAVFPANTALGKPLEDRRFRGGYTVITYGSHNSDGIDAIQLEIGSNLRKNPKFAKDLGQAIAKFYKSYLANQTR
jgi:N-formylglutamate amidohydrolase